MSRSAPICRLCRAGAVTCLGAIPESDFFAGRVLKHPIAGGDLWRCDECGSMFRHPVLSTREYSQLYVAGATDQWSTDAARNDLKIIREQIIQRGGTLRVLDIGCSIGGFLLMLPSEVQKFGVEPSTAAAAVASQAGVRIAGCMLDEVDPGQYFDVITLIDVIEHVADPMALLDQAAAHLAPGGRLIVATGDPLNSLWRRVFRSRFWYSGFPEHITFPSFQAFDLWRVRHGLTPPTALRIRYRALPLWRAGAHLVMMGVFLVSPGLLNVMGRSLERLRGSPEPRRRYFSSGAPGVFTDHQIVTFVRPAI